MTNHKAYIVAQAIAKNGISEIAFSVIDILDGKVPSDGTMPQAGQLRKYEPHPVGPLTSVG